MQHLFGAKYFAMRATQEIIDSIKVINSINAFELPMVSFKRQKKIGIYFLIKNNIIVYIGQSTDIEKRIFQHECKKDFDSYSYYECEIKMLSLYERIFLDKYLPVLNNDSETRRKKKSK